MRRRIVLLAAAIVAAACASSQSRMHRALDPSMEGVLRTEKYLFDVSGISGNPSRLTRGDGFVHLADLAPQMRYLANIGDRARYTALRSFVQERMMRRDPSGFAPARRYRADASFEPATAYGYLFLNKALRDAWQHFGDTTSAQLLAQIKWNEMPAAAQNTASYQLLARCAEAMDMVATDQAPGRAVLRDARGSFGSVKQDAKRAASAAPIADGEVDALSCLTRLGLAVQDADETVRYLDHLLAHLTPLRERSGRPDLGTTADVLLTLHLVREAGPRYYEPPAGRAR